MIYSVLCSTPPYPFETAGLFEEAEATLLEKCSVAMDHKVQFAVAESSLRLANLHLELGQNAAARRCFDTLRGNQFTHDRKRSMVEFNGVAARLALLGDRPSEARKFVPRSIAALKRIPVVFSRVYSASLCVAVELACGNVPSSALLDRAGGGSPPVTTHYLPGISSVCALCWLKGGRQRGTCGATTSATT